MSIFSKIINLGVVGPLSLSMGHPLNDRVRRLSQGKYKRGGSVTVLALIAGGLAMTGIAKEPSLLKQAGPLMAEFWTYMPDSEFPERLVTAELGTSQMTVNVHTEKEDMTLSLLAPSFVASGSEDIGDKFTSLLSKCFEHSVSENLPMIYFINDRLVMQDAPDQLYLVWCQPGDVNERALITSGDISNAHLLDFDIQPADTNRAKFFGYVAGVHIGEAIMRHSEQ